MAMKIRRSFLRRILYVIAFLFVLVNIIAFFHAYKFTHFVDKNKAKTQNPKKLSTLAKIKTLAFGVNNPRPTNYKIPKQEYNTIKLTYNREIECWSIKAKNSKGTIIVFHGYGGEKSSMLDKSDLFLEMGYDVLLVDFMGSGGSEGNQTTIGFLEAEQVKTSFDYIFNDGVKNIYLFGTSMGSVAIMKAIDDYEINPKAIIIECPFGSMYKTVEARFDIMNTPSFPMAGLLVFWGGAQNGFWAFGHNPTEYAKKIDCPTLLLYGEQDEKVSRAEIDEIFANISSKKQLVIYPRSGHENYLVKYKEKWKSDINTFLDENSN